MVRWLIKTDMPDVMDIENSFESPALEADLLEYLRNRACTGMVAEHRGRILGYMAYELCKEYMEVRYFRYTTDKAGRAMADKLKDKLSPQRRRTIAIEVPECDLETQLFLHDEDFQATRILEDKYLFEYALPLPENNRIRAYL